MMIGHFQSDASIRNNRRRPARAMAIGSEAERQFKATLVLMALIGSACIATTFATLVRFV